MKKGIITISVPKNTTQEELKQIRKNFQKNKLSDEYQLCIIISGQALAKDTLKDFMLTREQ